MSIIIHGMKMPNDENGFVKLVIFNDGRCFVAVGENEVTSKTGIVTARELPPHGRLIDVIALKNIAEPVKDHTGRTEMVVQMRYLGRVPTVIPAEEE